MSSHASLDAAAQERKARLAKLKSLKRKQPDTEPAGDTEISAPPAGQDADGEEPSATSAYLSGRNYDITARGPKLGFENNPNDGQDTVELRAKNLADEVKAQIDEEQKEDKPLDLFKLQPKKPNWDLKRDMEKKMEVLNVRTDNAIARLVRERITVQKQSAASSGAPGDIEAAGRPGEELVTALHTREQQEQEDEERERRLDAELEEGFT